MVICTLRSLMFAIASAVLVLGATAQDPVVETDSIIWCGGPDMVSAQFPGGQDKLYEFLAIKVHYPDSAKAHGIVGKVFIKFTVEVDGAISNAEVWRSVDPLLDAEALRVVQSMPNWKPSELDGKAVKSFWALPFNFK